MEKTVEQLEAMFQKAESDINYLSQKLDFEFDNSEDIQTNPAKMMQKLNDVKKEYSTLVEEAASIQKAQQIEIKFKVNEEAYESMFHHECLGSRQTGREAVVEFRNHISTTCQLLQKLQSNTGLKEGEKPEELEELEKLLGIELPSQSHASGSSQTSSTDSSNTSSKSDMKRDKS